VKRLAALLFVASAAFVAGAALLFAATPLPIDPADNAAALKLAAQLAGVLASHQWNLAIAPALTLIFWALHQPWTGATIAHIPGRYRPIVIFLIGTPLATIAVQANSGMPLNQAFFLGVLLPLCATGIWEMFSGLFPSLAHRDVDNGGVGPPSDPAAVADRGSKT
jgi:hypothetical protein